MALRKLNIRHIALAQYVGVRSCMQTFWGLPVLKPHYDKAAEYESKERHKICAENCIHAKHARATLREYAAVQFSPPCDHSPTSDFSRIR